MNSKHNELSQRVRENLPEVILKMWPACVNCRPFLPVEFSRTRSGNLPMPNYLLEFVIYETGRLKGKEFHDRMPILKKLFVACVLCI